MTAFAYIRRSSLPGRGTIAVSYEMQERAVRELAARYGDDVDGILSDWGRSGGSTRRRPSYRRLVEAIDAGEASVVYSYSLSRLSRSLLDFADLLERCRAHKVPIRLVQEGEIDYGSATGRAFAGMAAVFAQMERELAAERNIAAVGERVARGDTLGQAPYGFRIVRGQLTARKDEPVDAVAAAFQEAGSFGATARLLNERAIPTRHGRPWTHGVVSDVLRRTGAVPPGRPRAGAKPTQAAIFAGLLRCSCGAILTPRRDGGNLTGVSGYYCSRSYRIPKHGRMHTPEGRLLAWAKAEAARLVVPTDAYSETDDRVDRERVAAKRARIVDMAAEGIIDKADRDRRLRMVESEAERLVAKSQVVNVIREIDWQAPPAAINAVLRALWAEVRLDADLRPVEAEWIVPEWRAA